MAGLCERDRRLGEHLAELLLAEGFGQRLLLLIFREDQHFEHPHAHRPGRLERPQMHATRPARFGLGTGDVDLVDSDDYRNRGQTSEARGQRAGLKEDK